MSQRFSSRRNFLWGLAVLPGLAASHAFAQANAQTYSYLVFSDSLPDKADAYNAWYDTVHAPDVVAVPGFVTARRFILADEQYRKAAGAKPRYLIVYTIVTDDLKAVGAELARRAKSGETKFTDAIDNKTVETHLYRMFPKTFAGAGGEPASAKAGITRDYVHVVFGDPVFGEDNAFNEWYDAVHAPEMAAEPGFTAARRGVLNDIQMGPPKARSRYLALFDIKTSDLGAVLQTARSDTRMAVPPTAFDRDKAAGYTYRAIGPVIVGDDVRSQRADR